MNVTKYFIPLTDNTGHVHTSEWINTKGEMLLVPLLTYEFLVCLANSHASHFSLLLSTPLITLGILDTFYQKTHVSSYSDGLGL